MVNHLPLSISNPLNLIPHFDFSNFKFKDIFFNKFELALRILSNSLCYNTFEINSKMVKAITNLIALPLTTLFVLCIIDNIYPNDLKLTKVILVHKKGADLSMLLTNALDSNIKQNF